MPRTKPGYRSKSLLIRLTPDEQASLKISAAHSRLTVADYVRTRALDRPSAHLVTRVASPGEKEMAHVLGLLSDVGADVREMALQIGVGDNPLESELKYTLSRIVEASEAIMRALGAA